MTRVTSGLWVAAHVRRCNLEGAPAPQMMFDDAQPSDRLFQKVADGIDGAALAEKIERELRFDSDVWVVAIEDRGGRSFLDTV